MRPQTLATDYLFSSPNGDIRLTQEDLARPFLIRPSEPHPFLTLRDYFQAIETFLLSNGGRRMDRILRTRGIRDNGQAKVRRIRIRSEKHGALYHIASLHILLDRGSVKLAVSLAASDDAARFLVREYTTLKTLCESHRLPYLPRVYEKGEVVCQGPGGPSQTLTLMLSEWFEGWHEWHFSEGDADDCPRVAIWDLEKGRRYAAKIEAFDIFRQSARVLTLYYDPATFRQIHPWRHAAGDFVVKTGDDGLHVRLTTARNYRSIMDFLSERTADPLIAMAYFLLDLTVWMRLDRLDGVGDVVWAPDFTVQAVIQGVFEGLRVMSNEGALSFDQMETLASLLQSLKESELQKLFMPLVTLYEEGNPTEWRVIRTHLKGHIHSLRQTLQKFRR